MFHNRIVIVCLILSVMICNAGRKKGRKKLLSEKIASALLNIHDKAINQQSNKVEDQELKNKNKNIHWADQIVEKEVGDKASHNKDTEEAAQLLQRMASPKQDQASLDAQLLLMFSKKNG